MRAADLTTALLLMAGGVLVLWDSLRLGIGWGTDGPKSGFFPFWLAAALLLSCAVIAIKAIGKADPRPFVTRQALGPVLAVLAPATVFVALIQVVGLYVASGLYLGFYMRWIGRHSWLAIVALSVAFPLITFFVFEIWFLVPLPKGPLEAWLGY
jgi:putative tricarboxylic transport membrane protein